MAVLTRIKNNQITDSSILANTKVVPGSIVGSLFNANLTVASDVTITGNLTVQGASSYLTVASTNTYVNDPLIVLNNAFTGSNSYDIGLIFNRGNQISTALIWNENDNQFELTYTTETGTSYATINNSGFANLKIGNLVVDADATFGSISTTGDLSAVNLTLSGDLAVNGGDLTTTATTMSIFNANVTTVDLFGGASDIEFGTTTGTFKINNPAIIGSQITQDVFNTTATTVNAFGAATALVLGDTTGSTTVRNNLTTPGIVTFTNTQPANVMGQGALVVSGGQTVYGNLWVGGNINLLGESFVITGNSGQFFGDANGFGALYAGVTGFTSAPQTVLQTTGDYNGYVQVNHQNINNGNVASTDFIATADNGNASDTFVDMGINSSTYNVPGFGLSKINDGYLYVHGNLTTGGGNLLLATMHSNDIIFATNGQDTANEEARFKSEVGLIISRTTPSTDTTSGALQVAGGAGIAGNLNVGDNGVIAGDLAVNSGNLTTTAGTADVFNTVATTVNAFGAATTLGIGASTGTLTIGNPTVVGTETTQDVFNTVATTVNAFGAATTLILGDTAGVANIRNATTNILGNATVAGDTTLTGDLAVNGGDITTTAATINLLNDNATTVDAFKAATDLEFGATTGTLTINNPTVVGSQATQDVFNTTATTVNAFGAATTLILGDTAGVANIRNATTNIIGNATVGGTLAVTDDTTLTGDLAVNGGDITTTAATFNLLNDNATTVDAFKAATDLEFGATTGTLTINNPAVVGTQATQDVFNTAATTVNAFGAATTLILGDTAGVANIRNATTNILGNAVVGATLSANSIQSTPIGSETAASGKFTSVTDESLTATRVTFAGTGGDLDDSANLTFATDTLSIRNVSINGETNTIAAVSGNLNLSASTNVIDGTGATVSNIADPTDPQDAVTLSYLQTQINSGVTNLQTDNSDITITDDGNVAGVITTNVDGVLVSTITTNSASYFTDLLVIDDATSNVSVNGTLYASGAGTFDASVTINASTGNGLYVSNSTAQFAKTVTFDANIDVSGNINATDTTQSTTSLTGAITTSGGVGIAKNLNVGGDVVITGNLQVDGSVTSVNTATLDVEDLNITVAKGAASSAAANGAGLTIDGANATILWTNATQSINFNKNIVTPGANFTGTVAVAPRFTVTSFDGNSITTLSGNDITTSATTANLFNTTATTINFAGGATTLILGSTTGVANIRNATTNIIGAATVGSTLVVTNGANLNSTLGVTGATTLSNTLVVIGDTTLSNVSANLSLVGPSASANFTRFPNALAVVSSVSSGIQQNENHYVGILAEGVGDPSNTSVYGIGVYGVSYTTGGTRGTGVIGEGHVSATGDTGTSIGVRGYAHDTHAGGMNIGLFAEATSSAIANYALYMNSGHIYSAAAQNWTLVDDSNSALTLSTAGKSGILNVLTTNGAEGVTMSGTLGVTGATTLTGDLAVNGGDITTTASTATVFNTTATTVNAFGAATTLGIGAGTGTTTVNNNLTIGNGGELLTVNGSMIVEGGTYGNVTTTQFGSVYGRAYGPNATSLMQVKGNDGATGIGMRAVTGSTNLIYSSNGFEFRSNATVRDLDTPTGGTVYVTISSTGIVTLGNDIVSSTSTQNVFNTVATTVNAFGAATALNFGANTGTLTLRNPTVVGTETTQNLYNTTATTVNFAGAATTVNIGAITGTTTVNNNLDVGLSLSANDINGTVIGNVTPATGAFTSVTDTGLTATRVTYAGTGGLLSDSADFTYDAGILTVQNFSINGATAEISVIGGSGNVTLNPDAGGVIDATGSLISNIANPVSAQDAVTLDYLTTTLAAASANVIQQNNSDVTVTDSGTGTGIITANIGGVSTFEFATSSASFFSDFVTFDAITSNVAITGAAHISGNATVVGELSVNAQVTISDTTESDFAGGGALSVDGGISVGKSITVGGNLTVDGANVTFGDNTVFYSSYTTINNQGIYHEQGSGRRSIQIKANDNDYGGGIASGDSNGTYVFSATGMQFATGTTIRTNLTPTAFGNIGVQITQNGNLIAQSGAVSTSTSTGALVVVGGVGISDSLFVGNGAVINDTQSSENFVVKGTSSSSLFLADSTKNGVVFGGNLTSAVSGSVATFTGTSAIILPVGDISQRPSNSGATDVIGMARYSTSSNNIEFFDGASWQVAGSSFTLVTTNAFTGDGSEVNFTLSAPSTTSALIVAINGVVQYPTLSYSVGGINSDVLTFTEAPAVGDIIDARALSTSTTVSALTNGNGYVQFTVNDNFANVIAGASTVETRLSISAATGTATFMNDVVINGNLTVKGDTAGNINLGDSNTDNVIFFADINSNVVPNGNEIHNLGAPTARWANTYTDALVARIVIADATAVSVGTSDVVIDTFDATAYRSAKYVLSISNSSLGEYETTEVLVVHNGTTAYKNQYATMYTGTASLGTVSATYNSGTVELSYQGANAGNEVKIQSTYIKV